LKRLLEEAGVDFDVLEHAHTERAVDEAAADLVRLSQAQVADICKEEPTAG
jgi:hypothetical protein